MKFSDLNELKLRISLATAIACLGVTSSFSADSLESAFTQGKVSGNLQAWYITDNYTANSSNVNGNSIASGSKGNPVNRGEYAIGGNLGFVTSPYYGISSGVEFASSNIMSQNPNAQGNGSGTGSNAAFTSSTAGSLNYNANVITQAYINGQYGKSNAKIGEQAIYNPFISSQDGARIFYNTFRGAVLTNMDLPQTTLSAAYINGMETRNTAMYAYSSGANTGPGGSNSAGGVNAAGKGIPTANPAQGGVVNGQMITTSTGAAQTSVNAGYQGMDQIAFGSWTNFNFASVAVTNPATKAKYVSQFTNGITNGSNNPVYYFSAVNKSLEGSNLQAWVYNAVNMMNMYYLQADYALPIAKDVKVFAGAQYLLEQGTGAAKNFFQSTPGYATNAYLGTPVGTSGFCTNSVNSTGCSASINSQIFGVKAGVTYQDAIFTIAYSNTPKNLNATFDGSLIIPWGGYKSTLFTSFMLADATAGGTQATTFKAEYNFDGVLKGLYAQVAYGLYAASTSATRAFSSPSFLGGMTSYTGNVGYSSMYGELKYQYNKPFSIRWRLENDSYLGTPSAMNGTAQAGIGAPKGVIESRLMGIYAF